MSIHLYREMDRWVKSLHVRESFHFPLFIIHLCVKTRIYIQYNRILLKRGCFCSFLLLRCIITTGTIFFCSFLCINLPIFVILSGTLYFCVFLFIGITFKPFLRSKVELKCLCEIKDENDFIFFKFFGANEMISVYLDFCTFNMANDTCSFHVPASFCPAHLDKSWNGTMCWLLQRERYNTSHWIRRHVASSWQSTFHPLYHRLSAFMGI